MAPSLIFLCILCFLVGAATGYLIRAKTHPAAERPLPASEVEALVGSIYRDTGINSLKPTAISIDSHKDSENEGPKVQ